MKRFLTTTAIAIVLGTSAMAQTNNTTFSDAPFDMSINLNASDLLGARLYATEADIDPTMSMTAADATEWDDIGEINEIILTRDGQAQSVIVGVGGFLGLGEKDVSVNMGDLRFISDGENADDYFVVINANAAGLTEATAYERSAMDTEPAMNNDVVAADVNNEAVADTEMATTEATDTMGAPIERDGYTTVETADLTTEMLTGARVYGAADEDVGEIGLLLLSDDGQLDRAVIDVGGFLGMGERPVSVAMNELQIVRSDAGDDVRVYIDSSKEALEAQPEYQE